MDPVTVMTCIQVASSVAGMLSPKGPNIPDLLSIQTQMLKNISNQVAKLQEGINIIIKDISELKEFVEYKLPSEIHKKFVTDEQIAKFSGYNRVVNTYLEDRQEMGIIKSYNHNRGDIYENLKEIQSKRDELFLYKDYFLAPLVARCFKAEVDLMIILYGDLVTKGKFKQVLSEYENWLEDLQNKDNVYSVDYYINKFKGDWEEANQNTYGFRMCKLRESFREKITNFGETTTNYTHYINVEYFSFRRDFNPDLQQQMLVQNFNSQDLIDIYNLLQIDLKYIPAVVSQTVENKYKEEETTINYNDFSWSDVPSDGVKAGIHKGSPNDERFDVSREFLESLTGCENPNQAIHTNKKYYNSSAKVKSVGEKLVVPVTHKKIMLEIQNKIDKLRTFI